jgi:hypothetical protein
MRTRRPRLAPEAVQPLLALAQTQFAAGVPTLARAEEAVTQLFRQLGPELIEGLLQGALPAPSPEKGAPRSVRAGTPATATATDPAR